MPARRILVIDDEDDIREVVQVSLQLVGGWDVILARTGAEGLAAAAAQQPDAILLDATMPGLDGPAVFERLRTNSTTRHIPVILLTAQVQTAERRRFAELGMTYLIAKPFDPLRLPGQIADALGWSEE